MQPCRWPDMVHKQCMHVAMHIDVVPNRGSRPAYLLRIGARRRSRLQTDVGELVFALR